MRDLNHKTNQVRAFKTNQVRAFKTNQVRAFKTNQVRALLVLWLSHLIAELEVKGRSLTYS